MSDRKTSTNAPRSPAPPSPGSPSGPFGPTAVFPRDLPRLSRSLFSRAPLHSLSPRCFQVPPPLAPVMLHRLLGLSPALRLQLLLVPLPTPYPSRGEILLRLPRVGVRVFLRTISKPTFCLVYKPRPVSSFLCGTAAISVRPHFRNLRPFPFCETAAILVRPRLRSR